MTGLQGSVLPWAALLHEVGWLRLAMSGGEKEVNPIESIGDPPNELYDVNFQFTGWEVPETDRTILELGIKSKYQGNCAISSASAAA